MNKSKILLLAAVLAVSSLACEIEFVTATPAPVKSDLPTPSPVVNGEEDPQANVLAETEDEAQQNPDGQSITVTHEMVNLRMIDHAASGDFVKAGDVLAVECSQDGYCLILDGEHTGLYIWRGCTSDPAKYGCEAK